VVFFLQKIVTIHQRPSLYNNWKTVHSPCECLFRPWYARIVRTELLHDVSVAIGVRRNLPLVEIVLLENKASPQPRTHPSTKPWSCIFPADRAPTGSSALQEERAIATGPNRVLASRTGDRIISRRNDRFGRRHILWFRRRLFVLAPARKPVFPRRCRHQGTPVSTQPNTKTIATVLNMKILLRPRSPCPASIPLRQRVSDQRVVLFFFVTLACPPAAITTYCLPPGFN